MNLPSGTLVYDPVHRVPRKQEAATRRTHAPEGLGHLARLIGHKNLQGSLFKDVRRELEQVCLDPYRWTRLGADQTTQEQVFDFTHLLQRIQQATLDPDLLMYLSTLESKLSKTTYKPWTAILEVNPRHTSPFLRKIRGQGIKISSPAWGPHVTVVRGERPPNVQQMGFNCDYEYTMVDSGYNQWKIRNGDTFDFEIISEPKNNKNGHWWVDIRCRDLEEIRRQLGLPPQPRIPFHLTIGKEQ